MTSLLNRIHARVGDLWWYSAMLFVACRSGDVIQAFIGLWLVPKYVGPNELGAVLPLQQLSSFFTIPLAIIAIVFSKYVNTYATRGELGKVKSFIHDVIILSSALMLVCIAAAYWLIPHFYSRLNITAGSLTVLVLASGFVGNISNLFGSALQGLKKFKTMTIQSLISAPIRLVTLLIAMPFRPLSGYLLGQTTPAASCGILAALSIRRDLKNAPADTSWRKDLPEIWRYLLPIAIYTIFGTIFGTISATIYRQRLPEIESSAYYMLTRLADFAGFFGTTLTTVLTPLASEAHERGGDNIRVLRHATISTILATFILALAFTFTGRHILALNDVWKLYLPYTPILPLLTLISGFTAATSTIWAYEIACRRFLIPISGIIFSFFATCFLVISTGCEYFRGSLSDAIVDFLRSLHIDTLQNITIFNIIVAISLFALSLCAALFKNHPHQIANARN